MASPATNSPPKRLRVRSAARTPPCLPVDLPASWKIQPPQLIAFSFDDIPLANYSISGTAMPSLPRLQRDTDQPSNHEATEVPEATPEATQPVQVSIPVGPALPPQFGLLGTFFGVTLDTADDLLDIQLPEATAQQFGSSHPSAAQLLNNLVLLQNPQVLAALPFTARLALGALNIGSLISSISPDAIDFIDQNDPTFFSDLSPAVYSLLSDEALALPNAQPPLDTVWNNLANQPQFASAPLAHGERHPYAR